MSKESDTVYWSELYRSVLKQLRFEVYSTSDLHTLSEIKGITTRNINSVMGMKIARPNFWEQITELSMKKPRFFLYDAADNEIVGFISGISEIVSPEVLCSCALNDISMNLQEAGGNISKVLDAAEQLRCGTDEEKEQYENNKRSYHILLLALYHLDNVDLNIIRSIV